MKTKLFFTASFIMLCLFLLNTNAQIDVEQKAKDKSINRADQRTDEGIDKGLDAVEDGVKGLFKKKEKKPAAEVQKDENQDENSEEAEKTAAKKTETPKPLQEPTLQSATKYDFVPGDKVILYDDFSQDEIGDFPALWTTSGSGEVRTLNLFPGRWLYMNAKDKTYTLMKDLNLTENFIFEFDVVPTTVEEEGDLSSFCLTLFAGSGEYMNDDLYPGQGGIHITCTLNGWDVTTYKEGATEVAGGSSQLAPMEINKLNHIIVWVQKRRLRVYHKGQKVVDLPTIIYEGTKCNRLRYSLWSQQGLPYISNVRFTTAKPDMRSKLLTEGKIVSYGIYFDINSDKVKAESYGTLKEIAQVLTENPAVRIKIVGHTDGDGDAAKNLDLSKRRAASVKSELSKTFSIDAGRIETDGKGKTEPIAPNDTPANKAQNRRVEFIKL
jgi:OmpA-OmpF porin, OOP family